MSLSQRGDSCTSPSRRDNGDPYPNMSLTALRRLKRAGNLEPRGWVLIAMASLVDVLAAIFVFVVTPTVSGEPLSVVMGLPDNRILIGAIIFGVGWA